MGVAGSKRKNYSRPGIIGVRPDQFWKMFPNGNSRRIEAGMSFEGLLPVVDFMSVVDIIATSAYVLPK
jgi:hypothetical protein